MNIVKSDQIIFRATQRLGSHKFLIKLFLFDFENDNFYYQIFLSNIFFFIRKFFKKFCNKI